MQNLSIKDIGYNIILPELKAVNYFFCSSFSKHISVSDKNSQKKQGFIVFESPQSLNYKIIRKENN